MLSNCDLVSNVSPLLIFCRYQMKCKSVSNVSPRYNHRFYLPGSVLIGGLVLSLASIAAKNSIPGVMVPVGIVTSLVGVPFFLSIVLRHRGSL